MIINKIRQNIIEKELFKDKSNIIIALSGGSDSIFLTHALNLLKSEFKINIYAFHLNHLLRGDESFQNESFVSKFCKKNKIHLYSFRKDISKIALENKIGLEEAGRNIRYDILNRLSQKLSSKIATGHNLSDRIETFIFNSIRGSSLSGLCSIPIKRENIIRPLYNISKQQIDSYCDKHHIPYIIDSSNLSKKYTRNKIRLDVIPILKEINPETEKNFSNLLNIISQDNDFLNKLAVESLKKSRINENIYNLKILSTLPSPILLRVISSILKSYNVSVDYKKIDSIKYAIKNNLDKFKLNISKEKYIYISENFINIETIIPKKNLDFFSFKLDKNQLLKGQKIDFLQSIYFFRVIPRKMIPYLKKKYKKVCFFYLDYDKIVEDLYFRQWIYGDKISILGRGCTKSLKKIFNENKIIPYDRFNIPILSTTEKIVWLDRFNISSDFQLDEYTKFCLIIIKY